MTGKGLALRAPFGHDGTRILAAVRARNARQER